MGVLSTRPNKGSQRKLECGSAYSTRRGVWFADFAHFTSVYMQGVHRRVIDGCPRITSLNKNEKTGTINQGENDTLLELLPEVILKRRGPTTPSSELEAVFQPNKTVSSPKPPLASKRW